MHILWINHHAAHLGGCERYIWDTVHLLRERGVSASLCYDPNAQVEVSYLQAFDQAYPLVALPSLLRSLRPDLIYLQQLPSYCDLSTLLQVSRDLGIPVARFYHDNQLFCLREHKYTTLSKTTCTRPLGAHCYPCLGFVNRSDHFPGLRLQTVRALRAQHRVNQGLQAFVVGSEYMAAQLRAHDFADDKISVNPLFARDLRSAETVSEADAWPQDFRLLYVGQVNTGKGLDILLQALAQLSKPVPLTVIGTGRQYDAFQALSQRLGLRDSVSFLGQLPPEALSQHYLAATCVVYPGRRPETFGLVGIEAMMHARPVIASAIGAVPEWLADGQTGRLFASGNATHLAERIQELQCAPERARQMGLNGRQCFLARYLPEHHITRLLQLFARLVPAESEHVV